MKIVTYNINGIRSAIAKNLKQWMTAENADIFCLQEIKADKEQIPVEIFEELGYQSYWYPAKKKGYSGVAILTKINPTNIIYGMNIEKYDIEGRFLRIEIGDLSIVSVYHPSGSSSEERQDFKMQWLEDFKQYIDKLKMQHPKLIVCGDFNICHKPIDIHDPVGNKNSSGFLPEERQWLDDFLNSGFVDCFRYFNPEPHQYTWWSYRANARSKNKGWRIDYAMCSEVLKHDLIGAQILSEIKHSDHCPVRMELNIK